MYRYAQRFKQEMLLLSVSRFWAFLAFLVTISFLYEEIKYLFDVPLFLISFSMRFIVKILSILNLWKC